MAPSAPPSPTDVSYRTLRRVVGLLGVVLPVLLAAWGFVLLGALQLEPSISDYCRLRTNDLLVGVLFTVGWFLFAYRGYSWEDELAGKVACVAALGVALFPLCGSGVDRALHFVSAGTLFATLAVFSLFLFTRSGGDPTRMKLVRNRLYRVCGVVMFLCLGLIGLCYLLPLSPELSRLSPVFWLETALLWSFGLSWFVKGETILKDR